MVLFGRDFASGTTMDSNGHVIQERCPLSGWCVLQCFTGSEEPSSEAENAGPRLDKMLIMGRSFVLRQPLGESKLQPKILPVLNQRRWDGRADPESLVLRGSPGVPQHWRQLGAAGEAGDLCVCPPMPPSLIEATRAGAALRSSAGTPLPLS